MKKLFAMVLALLMVLGLATTVFAAEPDHSDHTITIKNSHEGYHYSAYQIFSGNVRDDGVLGDVAWGSGVNDEAMLTKLKTIPAYASCASAADVAKVLAASTAAMDDPNAIAFARVAAEYLTETKKDSVYSTTTKQYTITGLTDGYYLVVNDSVPSGENTTVSRYIMEVVRNIEVAHKGSFPTVEKKIVEQQVEVDVNQAPVGGVVNYKITGTVPANIAHYNTYFYKFTDTLSKGLTYNGDMMVTVNGQDATSSFTISPGTYDAAKGTTITVSIANLKTLGVTHDTRVVLTYSATVNENAVIAGTGNPNKVYLEYDNNPNTDDDNDPSTPDEPRGRTPEDKVETYTTELTIKKIDGQGKLLTGAEFSLTGPSVKTVIVTRQIFELPTEGQTPSYYKLKDGTYTDKAPTDATKDGYEDLTARYVLNTKVQVVASGEHKTVKAYVDDNGFVTFSGLGAGDYILTETKTPGGYNTIEQIRFKIEFDPQTKQFNADNNNWIMNENDNTLSATIINVAGTTLPSTGGIGTTLFYIIGGALFLGAAVLLVTKKRMAADQ